MANPLAIMKGDGDRTHALVVIFLRGAADGLHMVPAVEDGNYFNSRPRIAVAKRDAIPLNGFFALHPLLQPLKAIWDDKQLAIVHAAGSEDDTRSHFEAQDLMEHGGVAAGGWLGRFLRLQSRPVASALQAVALSTHFPEVLRGAPAATVLESLDDFSLGEKTEKLTRQLARLYGARTDDLAAAGRTTIESLGKIERMRAMPYQPERGAEYGANHFGHSLAQVARLIKARVGLEAASVDLDGWDSHFAQNTVMDPRMANLAKGLRAFYTDLGREMEHTTVVVMTEFGRRLTENTSFGTDHGRGGVMFLMGGGICGGRMIGKWPGLAEASLVGPGDLEVVNNYRNVLAPILLKLGVGESMRAVFPDFEIEPLAIY